MSDRKERVVRSKEERLQEIEAKIKKHEADIEQLKLKKERILNPSPRKGRTGMKTIIDKAKEQGLTPEQIAEKLGITL